MSRNNSPARRAQRAAAAAVRDQASTILGEAPAELSDRVLRRLCWRARGWAWKAGWR